MYEALVKHIAHRVVRQAVSAQVHHSDVVHRAVMPEKARSAGCEPNDGPDGSGTHFMSIADGGDEDLMGIENSLLGQVLKIMFFKLHGETRVQFAEQPKGRQYMEKFQ